MNKRLTILIAVGIFLGIFLYSSLKSVEPQKIENAPNWISLEAAQKEAIENDKLIMVDVYEVGCKYCRAMEREVYPDTTVRIVIDQGYIPVKLDGNSEELIRFNGEEVAARDFAQSKGAYAFPTVLVLTADGKVVKKRTGFMNVDELRQFLYNPGS
ncbi:MAG: thioredoxin fold domain-containing protein [Balneola sp.]